MRKLWTIYQVTAIEFAHEFPHTAVNHKWNQWSAAFHEAMSLARNLVRKVVAEISLDVALLISIYKVCDFHPKWATDDCFFHSKLVL